MFRSLYYWNILAFSELEREREEYLLYAKVILERHTAYSARLRDESLWWWVEGGARGKTGQNFRPRRYILGA